MNELLAQIAPLMVPVVVALFAWLSAYATKWINAKVQNEYLHGALHRLTDAVSTAVKSTEQTLAQDILKASEDGKFTDEEAEQVKNHAIASVKSYLGDKGIAELKRVIDPSAIEKMIEDKIEAYLDDRKLELLSVVGAIADKKLVPAEPKGDPAS